MKKIGRNDPCPCGSGKKYKKCCMNKENIETLFSEIYNKKQGKLSEYDKNNIDKIKEEFRKYNLIDLFLWLQVSSLLFQNQKYSLRFLLLTIILLSIEPFDFKNQALNQRKFRDVIEICINNLSSFSLFIDDFTPFDQNKLIPIFYQRKKFYFFYGVLERPYEFLKNLCELYHEIIFITDLIDESLKFQDELILELQLKNNDFKYISAGNIIIPDDNFFNYYSKYFQIDDFKLKNIHGYPYLINNDFIDLPFEEALRGIFKTDFLSSIYLKIDENYYYFSPQFHIEILFKMAFDYTNANFDIYNQILQKNYYNRFIDKMVNSFSWKILDFNSLSEELKLSFNLFDLGYLYDDNIILIKSFGIYNNDNIIQLKSEISKTNIFIKKLLKKEFITKNQYKVICIFLYETSILDLNLELPFLSNCLILLNFLDFQAIFECLPIQDRVLRFVKYLKTYKEYEESLSYTDFLDNFIIYLNNSESFSYDGNHFDKLIITAHSWNDFYMNKVFDKYQDNIYEIIETKFDGYYNLVNRIDENKSIYELVNLSNNDFSLGVKWNDDLIVIINGDAIYYGNKQYIELINGTLRYLFAHYFNHYSNDFKNVLKNLFDSWSNFSIEIFSSDIIFKKKSELNYLIGTANDLNEENPINFITLANPKPNKIIRTFVVIDISNIHNIFDGQSNKGEKYIIKLLFRSILNYFNIKNDVEISNIIDVIIPNAAKSFDIKTTHVYNPILYNYPNYIETHDHDLSKVHTLICNYLNKKQFTVGKHEYEQAKNIIDAVFDYLYKYVLEIIRKFDKNYLIQFVYHQIEIIEGNREKYNLQISLDATNPNIEFNLQEEHVKKTNNISKAAVSTKYLFSLIQNGDDGSFGIMKITIQEWQIIASIIDTLHYFANLSDLLFYKLAKISVNISESYNYEIEIIDHFMDIEDFSHTRAKLNLNKLAEKFIDFKEKNIDTDLLDDFKDLDKIFEECLRFKFSNMLFVLYVLGVSDNFSSSTKQLIIVNKNFAIQKIIENIAIQIDKGEIENILNFLFFKQMNSDGFIPSKVVKNKSRINLFPLVVINADNFMFGHQLCLKSFELWHEYLMSGVFPLETDGAVNYSIIEKHLEKYRDELDKQLEKDVYEISSSILGENKTEFRLKKYINLGINNTENKEIECGEIDLLGINEKNKTIFVIDAKNINKSLTIAEINREINKFFKDKSYFYHLNKKYDFILTYKNEVLKHFKVTDFENWKVKKAFVLQGIYPSAFSKRAKSENVDFVPISELKNYLQNF